MAPNGLNSPANAHNLYCQDLNALQLEDGRFWHYTDDITLREAYTLWKRYRQIYKPLHTTYTSVAGQLLLVKFLCIIWSLRAEKSPPKVKNQLL